MTRTVLTFSAALVLLVLAAAAFDQTSEDDDATRCWILCQR